MTTVTPGVFLLFGGIESSGYSAFISQLVARSLAPLIVDRPDAVWAGAPPPNVVEVRLDPGDVPGLITLLFEARARGRISGVFNTSEHFVELAALACELLALPGPGLRAARIARNKLLQRAFLEQLSPPHVTFRAGQIPPGFAHFPAVLKALDRSGGDGVRVLREPADLTRALPDYAPGEPVLLERFEAGLDFSVEALVHDCDVIFENVTEEADSPRGKEHLELGYTLPARRLSDAQLARAYEVNRAAVRALRVHSGFVHAEYRAQGDRIVLMELAVRVPGDGLLAMYECSTGAALEATIIDNALGLRTAHPAPRRLARQLYFEVPAAVAHRASLKGLDVEASFHAEPNDPPPAGTACPVRSLRLNVRRSQPLPVVRNAVDRHGSIIFHAADADELDRIERHVRDNLEVVTNEGTVHARFY